MTRAETIENLQEIIADMKNPNLGGCGECGSFDAISLLEEVERLKKLVKDIVNIKYYDDEAGMNESVYQLLTDEMISELPEGCVD